jgi:hypothetical protein
MRIPPQLMMGAGIAVAGLGLIGAGAGATFTAQVAASTSVSTGHVALSLNGRTGSNVRLEVGGNNLGTHFAPIRQALRLRNTGSLNIPSAYLDVTATGCSGGDGTALAHALRVTVTDVTHSRQLYDGAVCSAEGALAAPLGYPLRVGGSTLYELVLQPSDADQGLPADAQDSSTSVRVVFTGYDY